MQYEVIRLNDTYLTQWVNPYYSIDTPQTWLRCFAVQSTNVNYDSYTLVNGVYSAVFIAYNYQLAYNQFSIANIGSSNITLDENIGYIGTGTYITASLQVPSVGGLIPFNLPLIFEYDMIDLTACCDSNIVLPSSATFVYTFTPTPISIALNQYSTTRTSPYDVVQLSQGTTYTYNGYLYNSNTTLSGNGTFTVQSSGLSLSSDSFSYTLVLTGTVTNGQFVFQFAPRNNPNPVIYENIIVSWNTTSTSGYSIMLIFWESNPITTAPPTSSGGFGFSGNLGSFLGLFLLIFIPTMGFTIYLGTKGFLIGLSLMMGIGVITGLLPLWFIFMMGISMILLLFTNNVGGIRDRI